MTTPQAPITDSPWFWLYLFCTAGLIALAASSGKYQQRQARIEREYHATQVGRQSPEELDAEAPHQLMLPLQSLYVFFGVLLAIGWGSLWWKRFRVRASQTAAPADMPAPFFYFTPENTGFEHVMRQGRFLPARRLTSIGSPGSMPRNRKGLN